MLVFSMVSNEWGRTCWVWERFVVDETLKQWMAVSRTEVTIVKRSKTLLTAFIVSVIVIVIAINHVVFARDRLLHAQWPTIIGGFVIFNIVHNLADILCRFSPNKCHTHQCRLLVRDYREQVSLSLWYLLRWGTRTIFVIWSRFLFHGTRVANGGEQWQSHSHITIRHNFARIQWVQLG